VVIIHRAYDYGDKMTILYGVGIFSRLNRPFLSAQWSDIILVIRHKADKSS